MTTANELFPAPKNTNTAAAPQRTYLKDPNIKIYAKVIRIGGTDYSVQHLESVSRVRIEPSVITSVVTMALIGLLGGFLLGMILAVTLRYFGDFLVFLFALVGLGAGAYYGYRRARPTYAVRFGFSSGAAETIRSNDEDYVERLASALTRTMTENQ